MKPMDSYSRTFEVNKARERDEDEISNCYIVC